jgi:MinD-like ATPase involved in chromosome partitioning or flagellar assembly
MIPADIRLYTWIDVEEVLLRIQEQKQWPEWLVWARAYLDGLTLGIRPGTQLQAKSWLHEIYDPRFRTDLEPGREDWLIVLESTSRGSRTLPISLEETEEEPSHPRLVPSLARPGVLWPPDEQPMPPPPLSQDFPSVVTFHSFKGGVGRTIHALALAQAIAEKRRRVLLVDGDLEAPGISWLLQKRLPDPPVSFADFLALVHSDPDPQAQDSILLVAERLQSALIDGTYVLPSFRSTERFVSLEIRPDHLIQNAPNPFLLTHVLGALGKTLQVDAVLVDLRAGLSELAAGLILDPRVYRVFVTTLSSQALAGTVQLLELLGRRALSTREEDPLPALVITQISEDCQRSNLLAAEEQRLLEAAQPFLGDEEAKDLPRIFTSFDANLLVLPSTWEEVTARLHRSGIVDAMRPLLDWLPVKQAQAPKESDQSLQAKREMLRDRAGKLMYAESGEGEEFLATTPLRHLASDHRQQVPIAVVIGAKGAGKTYTFLQIVRRENWTIFAKDAGVADAQVEALIYPLLEAKNLNPAVQQSLQQVRRTTANALGLVSIEETSVIRDHIRDSLQVNLHERQWRERWLDVIAWGVGFRPQEQGAGRGLPSHLAQIGKQLLIVVDGLEDLFQDLSSNKAQQTALRALLQEAPDWLGQQPGRLLGILVFVRRDMVLAAVRQNAAQFMDRYEPYALKWNREEILRLVAWVASKASVLPNLVVERLQELKEQELVQHLLPLWGKKLGRDHSREARSTEFVIAALSDFKGQIQARDLVRLLHLAATKSVDDIQWKDRILTPHAIKDALSECSSKKIEEIEAESEALKAIFTKLHDLPDAKRQIPFSREGTQLSLEEIKVLEDNGVLLREEDEYYMPEIFRWGLKFSMQARARPRILSLARRAGQGG